MVDERPAPGVLAELGVHPEQRANQPLQRRLLALPAFVEAATDQVHRRHDRRADGVHHVVGVALEQGAEHQQLVQRRPLRLGLDRPQHAEHPGVVRVSPRRPALLDKFREPADHPADVVTAVGGQNSERARHVLHQPWIGGELHPVSHFVQAYP